MIGERLFYENQWWVVSKVSPTKLLIKTLNITNQRVKEIPK